MANSEDTFVPYFKVRWVRKASWTLDEGALLACGYDPGNLLELGIEQKRMLEEFRVFLSTRKAKGDLVPTPSERDDGKNEYIRKWSFFREFETHNMAVDSDLQKVADRIWSAPNNDYKTWVTRTVYREAGRLVFENHSEWRPMDTRFLSYQTRGRYLHGYLQSVIGQEERSRVQDRSALKVAPVGHP